MPTLREAANIQVLLSRIQAALDPLDIDYELIIVDDDSRDGIGAIIDGIRETNCNLRLITRKGERGLAGAVLDGWRDTDAGILGVIDADFQHPPELLPQLWRELTPDVDLVVASRYAAGGSLGQWKASRHLLSRMAIWMTLPLQRSTARAKDPMSGFFLVRRSCVDHLHLQRTGYKLLLEILVRGNIRAISEVPFVFGRRNRGDSKANARVAVDYIKLLAHLYKDRCIARSGQLLDSFLG